MKKTLYVLLILFSVGVIIFFLIDESMPEGKSGPDAEALAERMLVAINVEAWEQIPFISWSFRDAHHYVWDKQNHLVLVKWEDYEAVIDLNLIKGKATRSGKALEGAEREEAVLNAWAFFCNDSFWLNAPAKAFDDGATRKIVVDENGSDQLLIQYESVGVTPGDAYLWQLDENYLPVSYKMWVSIIPFGGVKSTWSDWKEFDGAMISTSHNLGPLEIAVRDIKTGTSLQDFGLAPNLFDLSFQ